MKGLMLACLCGLLGAGAMCQEAASPAPGGELVSVQDEARIQVAKLRGRLLYKKNQIKKLEKSACTANQELKERMAKAEQERRTQFIAAEPKLQSLYAEQDALESEIQKLLPSKN